VYPDGLFVPAPDLPSCGSNTRASRTWAEIHARDGRTLNTFCALERASDLERLSFSVPVDQPPPDAVYVVLTDRRFGQSFTSAPVPLKSP
jgi:hypothetical protein